MPRIKEKALKTELAKRGFESVAIKRELPAGRVEVEANKLHPVHVAGRERIYASIPVSRSVELGARGRVKSIDGGTPDPAAVAMPRAMSRRCATAGSWPPLENNSRLPA